MGRFGKLTCVAERSVTKAQMYELTAQSLGVPLDQCAAVKDTDIGVTDPRAARTPDAQRHGSRDRVPHRHDRSATVYGG